MQLFIFYCLQSGVKEYAGTTLFHENVAVNLMYKGNCATSRTISLIPDAQPAALLLTADHQQPRHYTPYVAITQVLSRAPDDGHISA